jgi:hypothetical protein
MENLLAILLGGVLTLAGTVVAGCFGFFSSRVERQHRHAALQRERLERMSDCVGECVEWSQNVLTLKSLIEIQGKHLPPGTRRMVALAQIYFPDLVKPTVAYANSLVLYHVLAINSFRKDAPPGATVGQMMYLDPAKMRPVEDEQLALRNKVDEAIALEATKYEPSA